MNFLGNAQALIIDLRQKMEVAARYDPDPEQLSLQWRPGPSDDFIIARKTPPRTMDPAFTSRQTPSGMPMYAY